MDNVNQKTVHIKTIEELKNIAKCIKSTKLIHAYELLVHSFENQDADDNGENGCTCFYIPLKHLFDYNYGCAIVSFIKQRENLLLQINLMQSFNVPDDVNDTHAWRNFTYSHVANGYSRNFIADFSCPKTQEYVIAYSQRNTPPTLLLIPYSEKKKSCISIQFWLLLVVSIVCWLYGFYVYLDCQYNSIVNDYCNENL